jgi:tetratricopeptide (TPR) repeat protein
MTLLIKHRFCLASVARLCIAIIIVSTFAFAAPQQPAAGSASIHGIVRDQKGNLIPDVLVTLRASDSSASLTTRTDSQGRYEFSTLQEAVYSLRAEMVGFQTVSISSIALGTKKSQSEPSDESSNKPPDQSKSFDLVLVTANSAASRNPSEPAFFDPPRFTVSGVTDTTNSGGHSSGAVVRAQQTIAKDTISLEKQPSAFPTVEITAKEVAAAEQSLRERVAQTPDNFELNHRLGALLITDAKPAQAILYLEHAAQIKPDDFNNSYELALANANAGNNARARDEAQALLMRTLAPHDAASLHHLLAEVDEKLGDNLAAVGEYQRAAELDVSEPNFFDWGAELLLHHAPEPAGEVFAKGNRLFPSSERMLIGLGAAWFAQDDFDQAVQKICEASDLNPNDSVPYLFLGKIETSQTVPSAKIVETLYRFVTLHSDNAEANYYYALGLWKRRADGASTQPIESLLNRAIDLNPDFASAYLQRGILRAERGDAAKAIDDYQRAIQAALRTKDAESANSELQDAHYRLAQAYRRMGDQEKAKAELDLYENMTKESAQHADQERRDIRQFVYTLRGQPSVH